MLEPLTLLNFLITLCLIVGGFVAYRQGFEKTANEVQERVITALQSEIHALQDRVIALEKENVQLNHVLNTVCASLSRRGIQVKVDGDTVSIHDHLDGSCVSNTRIQGSTENNAQETTRGMASKKRTNSTKRTMNEEQL